MSENVDSFKKLFFDYSRESEEQWFHSTIYCQKMINPKLLRKIEKSWDINEPYPTKDYLKKIMDDQHPTEEIMEKREKLELDEQKYPIPKDFPFISRWKKTYPLKEGEELPDFEYEMHESFTEEEILEILKLSPTALEKVIYGYPIEGMGRIHFEETLIASMILDSINIYYPRHEFEAEMRIEIRKRTLGERKQNILERYVVHTSNYQPLHE
jgi:hypothetical protein